MMGNLYLTTAMKKMANISRRQQLFNGNQTLRKNCYKKHSNSGKGLILDNQKVIRDVEQLLRVILNSRGQMRCYDVLNNCFAKLIGHKFGQQEISQGLIQQQ
ncbi:unnamed protein product [Paramecium octaurelia]|uniref:Uncharacterized protein n=1 Tax=Paramecium octaurelia TaxID=43137 RepID=A0A8S1UXM2_PAROT|nr:unnamed protein product [Paramecium octaurelia]